MTMTSRTVVSIVGATLMLAASAAAQTPNSVQREGAPGWSEDVPVPGGTSAMARALDVKPVPDRPRFLGELVRVLYDAPEGQNQVTTQRVARLTAYVNGVGRLQASLDAMRAKGPGFSLAMAATSDRARLDEFLALATLKIRGRSPMHVERATDNRSTERARQLADVGVDVAEIEKQLNTGGTVRVELTAEAVPVPLGSRFWSDVVFRHAVAPSALFAAIVSDRRAALLALGLASLDDETLRFLNGNQPLLRWLYEEHSGSFAAFAEALRVRDGRVVPPGGAQSLSVWETVLGVKASTADRFIRELFGAAHGRVALVYTTLAHLDAPHVRFALGSWIADSRARAEQFKALLSAEGQFSEWDVEQRPFTRPSYDCTLLLTRVRVAQDGQPSPPAARLFWRRAFDGIDTPDDPARLLRNLQEEGVVDAGWLAQNANVVDPRVRRERLDQLSFAQRRFASVPEPALGDALVAVRTLPRFHMLMLTLERMGVRDPRMYAAAARHAGSLSSLEGRRAFVAYGQLQGALALLDRFARVRRLQPAQIEALTAALLKTPVSVGSYNGGVARWMSGDLRAALKLAPDADVDDELVRALAGVETPVNTLPRVTWEGHAYRLDFVAAEQSRLSRARQKMDAPPIGAALDLAAAAATLASASADSARVRDAIAALRKLAPVLPASDKKNFVAPAGVEAPPNVAALVNRALAEQAKGGAHAGEALVVAADDVLAQALMSLAYALEIGDPEGTTLLGGDPSRRHEFQVAIGNGDMRLRAPWAEPREVSDEGAKHVAGSLLGLDLGLATLALRRVNVGSLPPAPTLTMPDRQVFLRTLALMNPIDFNDADQTAIVAAIRRGRDRLSSIRQNPGAWDEAAAQLGIDGWRRIAGRWAIAHDPEALSSFVSLTELAALGSAAPGRDETFDRWGMEGMPTDGCLCTLTPPPGRLTVVGGRPQIGLIATQMADLNLRVAERLEAASLPASLAPAVLAAAVQDFVERANPLHPNDWLTLVRAAQAVPDDRIDDYIASLTTGGPLIIDRPASDYGRRAW
jgi:hypothetical protein